MAGAGGTCICKKTYSTTIEDTEPVIGNLVAPWKRPLQKRVPFFSEGLRIAIGLVPVSASQNSYPSDTTSRRWDYQAARTAPSSPHWGYRQSDGCGRGREERP